ncbi:MAG: AgmX/PglI C-terminal domain-containing protein [Deltaproteobacteria bacterium]|nr:AgmX/PglI C-terminal domain-containing protein [Deltaproteobacteria bacterium]
MRLLLLPLALIVGCVASTPAPSQQTSAMTTPAAAAPAGPPRRVLVSDVVGNGTTPEETKTVTALLVTRLGRKRGIQAFSGAELRQLMALEAEKQATCADDVSCLSEISDALGAPMALMSDLGHLGSLTVMNLTLFDVENAVPLARVPVEADKPEHLPRLIDAAIDELLAAAAPRDRLALTSPSPSPPPPGSSSSSSSSPSPPPPGPPPAPPPAKGLMPSEIQRVVRAHSGELGGCYEAALGRDAKLTGTVTVRFLIAADGTVAWASVSPGASLKEAAMHKCLIGVVGTWTFAAPGQPTTISYPFVFKPAS